MKSHRLAITLAVATVTAAGTVFTIRHQAANRLSKQLTDGFVTSLANAQNQKSAQLNKDLNDGFIRSLQQSR